MKSNWFAEVGIPTAGAKIGVLLSLLVIGLPLAWAADEVANSNADKKMPPWEKGSIRFGGFVTAFDSSLGFGIENGPTVMINGEDGLGLESSLTVLRLDAAYRPGESRRHQLDFTLISYKREGQKTVSEEIDRGEGQVLEAGAKVTTLFNFEFIRTTYTYAFLQDDRMRIAAGLGVYIMPIEYGLTVETTGGVSAIEGGNVVLPLPALAVRAEFLLVPKLYLNLELNLMYAQYDEFEGSLMENLLGLEYRPWNFLGLGVAFSGMAVHVEGSTETSYPGADFSGEIDFQYSGLLLYGKLMF
jgi:hypothetical protein